MIAGVWLLHLGHDAEMQLNVARADITLLRADVRKDDTSTAGPLEQDLAAHSRAALKDSRDPVWRVVAKIPDLGNDFKVAGGLAQVANQLAVSALPPLVQATDGLRADTIRRSDGSIDLATVQSVGRSVTAAIPAVSSARKTIAGLNERVHLGDIARARTELSTELSSVQISLQTANEALGLLPSMLGGTTPRNYFLVFQNLNEARGTGGLMGSWGVLTADNGKLTLSQSGNGVQLEHSAALKPATIEPAGDYGSTWAMFNPLEDYFVANVSPNFPDAGQLFSEHADQQFGKQFDGVIAIDPLTLAALLGPDSVTLSDGTKVTGSNVARVTESDLYNKYGEDSAVRRNLLTELAKTAFDEVRTAPTSRVLSALQSSAGRGRVQIWSSHASEEATLSQTDIGGALPDAPGPFAWVGVNNTGPKTDFWLDRSLTYSTAACPAPKAADQTRNSDIDVTLTDRVPPGQNTVISHDEDDPTAPYGRGHDYVSVYGPVGAEYASATLNGAPVDVSTSTERGHLVMSVDLLEPDGVPQKLVFHIVEPAKGAFTTWRPQPLARAETVTNSVKVC